MGKELYSNRPEMKASEVGGITEVMNDGVMNNEVMNDEDIISDFKTAKQNRANDLRQIPELRNRIKRLTAPPLITPSHPISNSNSHSTSNSNSHATSTTATTHAQRKNTAATLALQNSIHEAEALKNARNACDQVIEVSLQLKKIMEAIFSRYHVDEAQAQAAKLTLLNLHQKSEQLISVVKHEVVKKDGLKK